MSSEANRRIYAATVALCGAILGGFAALCFVFLNGHTNGAILHNLFHMSFWGFLVFGGVIGALLGWLKGHSEALKRFPKT